MTYTDHHTHMQHLRAHRDAHALDDPIPITDTETLTHLSDELAVVRYIGGDMYFANIAGRWYPLTTPGMTTVAVTDMADRIAKELLKYWVPVGLASADQNTIQAEDDLFDETRL